jgi:hypothetical protein
VFFFSGSKFCPFLINNFSHGVPSCNISNITHFSISHKNYPSSRRATTANLVCSNVDVFRRPLISSIFETDLTTVTRSFVLRFNYLANLNFNFLTYLVTNTEMCFSLSHKPILSICSGYDVLERYIIILRFDINIS